MVKPNTSTRTFKQTLKRTLMQTRLAQSLLCAGLLLPAAACALQPQPLLRQGSCPGGYSQSGSYCVPGTHARLAVPRHGSCPSGYAQSGEYCLAGSDRSRLAIPRVGSCPGGYSQSGHYCLSNR